MNRNIFNRSGFSLIGFCRNKALRKVLATWCAFATLATTCSPAWAALSDAAINSMSSNITGDDTVAGAQSFSMTGSAGVIDWTKLNVWGGEKLNFNSDGAWYNVVNSASGMTTIQGEVNGTSGANVMIFNPNGVLVGNGGVINVGGIFGAFAMGLDLTANPTALTEWIANPEAVPDGSYFTTGAGDISIEKGATITAGDIKLAGANVLFGGVTTGGTAAPQLNGDVTVTAGNALVIDNVAGGNISLDVSATSGNADLMGAFANKLVVKANAANVAGALKVGSTDDPAAGDLVVGETLKVDGPLSVVKTVSQEADITVDGDFSVGGNTLTVDGGDLNVTGDLTVKSGDGKVLQNDGTVKVTGANGIVGSVTQDGDNTSVTLSATKISGDVTQKKGSMGIVKTSEVGGDYHLYGGKLTGVAENGDVTINGALEQTYESTVDVGTGTLVLKGGVTQANKDDIGITAATVEFGGTGTETVKMLGNANEIGAIKGSADTIEIDNGEAAVTVADDLTVNTLTVAKITQDGQGKTITSATGKDLVINGEVTQVAGSIAAVSGQKTTIDGAFTQDQADTKTAVLGSTADAVEITGALTQTKGTITASTLTLDGAATQTEGAKVVATTAVALDAAGNDVALSSSVNEISKIGGATTSVNLASKTDVEVNNLVLTESATDAADNNLTITAKDGTDMKTVNFTGTTTSGNKFTLTAGDVTQGSGSKITANEVAVTVTKDGDSTGAVTLNGTAGNAIKKVSGSATSVDLVTTTDLAVGTLGTGNGAITLDAGANSVDFTGAVAAGDLTLKSAAKQTSGSITAGKIDNSTTPVLFTQNGGTITTPSVTGAFTQNGGTIAAAAPADPEDPNSTLTFGGAVTQNFAADGSDPAVIGLDTRRNDVVFNGAFAQGGKAEGKTVAPILNAGAVEFKTAIAEDAVNGTMNVNKIVGDVDMTLAPDEIGEGFVLDNDNVTIKTTTIGDGFTQSGGTLLAKGSSGIEFLGSFTQSGGAVGDSTFDIIVDGLLTQSAGSIFAKMLTLKSGATQTEGAVVSATTLTLGDGVTPAGAVSLGSTANLIKEVGGVADSLVLRTGELSAGAGLTVKNLTTTDDSSLTVKKSDDSAVYTLTFDGVNAIATGDGKKLTVDAGAVGQVGGSSLKTTELDLPATVVTLTQGGNEIKKVSGSATSVNLASKTDVEVNDLVLTESATDAADNNLTITAKDGTDMKAVNFTGTTTSGNKFTLTAGEVKQGSGSKITANEIAVTVTADGDSTGAVTLNEAANVIKTVDGSAASADIASATDLTVTGLDTSAANGTITLSAGDNTVKFTTGTTDAGTGTITLKSAAEVVSGSVTAGKIDNGTANKLLTQTSGTITTPEVTGDFTQNGGSLTSAADVKIGGTLDQNAGGTITAQKLTLSKASTVAAAVNATSIDATGVTITQDGAGTVNVTGADGIKATTVVQNGGGTIYTKKVTGDVSQTAAGGTLNGNGSDLEITGTVGQTGTTVGSAVIGQAAKNVTIGGKLTQTKGTINASTLALNGGAEQATPANGQVVNATTLALSGSANDVALTSEANTIGTVQGEGKAITVVDSTGGLVVGALTANGALDLTTRAGDITQTGAITAKDTASFTAANAGDTSRGDITLDNVGNAFKNDKTVAAKGANIKLVDKDSIMLGRVDAKGTLGVTAKEGNITQSTVASENITTTGEATFKAVDGDIVLNNPKNDFGAAVNLDATQSVTIKDDNSLKLGKVRAGTDLDVEIINGNLTQKMPGVGYVTGDHIEVGGNTKITVGGSYGTPTWTGDVDLSNPNNKFSGKVDVADGYDVKLYSTGNMKLNTVAAKGSLDVSAESITAETTADIKSGTAMYTAHSTVDGDSDGYPDHAAMTLTARNGSVTTPGSAKINAENGKLTVDASVAGGISLAGEVKALAADFKANAGQGVNVSNDNNDFGSGEVAASGASVTLKDSNSIKLANVSAKAGSVDVTALDGDITVVAEKQVEATQNVQLTAKDKDTTDSTVKGNIALAAGSKVKSGSAGNITLDADGGVSSSAAAGLVAASEIESGALLAVNARQDDIALHGVVKSGGAATFNAKDSAGTAYYDVTVDNAASVFTAQVNAEGNDVTFGAGAGGIMLGDVKTHNADTSGTDDGDLTVTTANGTISQSSNGVVVEGNTVLDAGTANVTLSSTDNDFKGAVSAAGATITLVDGNSIELNQIDAGVNLAVTAKNGDITETTTPEGEIVVNGSTTLVAESSTTGKGKVTLEGKNKMNGYVNIDADDAITVRNDSKLQIGTIVNDAGDIVLYTTDSTPVFDDTLAYAIGVEVVYDNVHYKATAAHAANDGWVPANWSAVAGNPQSDIILASGKTVESKQGSVTLSAYNDLNVGTASENGTITAKNGITLRGGRNYSANTFRVADPNTGNIFGDVTLDKGAKLEFDSSAQANLLVTANKDVTIEKPGDNAPIAVPNGKVEVWADKGDINSHRAITTTVTPSGAASESLIRMYAGRDVLIDNNLTASAKIAANKDGIDIEAKRDLTVQMQDSSTPDPVLSAETTVTMVSSGTGNVLVKDASQVLAKNDIKIEADRGNVTVQDTAKVVAGTSTTDGSVTIHAAKDKTTGAGTATIQDTAQVAASKVIEVVAKDDVKVLNQAKVLATGTGVTAGNDTLKFEAQNGDIVVKSDAAAPATVIAGTVVDENTFSGNNQMTLLAANNVKVQNMGVVAASGKMDATATAGDILVANNAKVAAGGALTGTANNDIKISDNGIVAADKTITLNATAGDIWVTENAKVIATKSITAGAGNDVYVWDNAKVAAGKLPADTDANVSLTAGNDMMVDGEVQARGNVTLQAAGDVSIFDDTLTTGKKYEAFDGDTTGVAYDDTTKGLVKAQTGSVQIDATGAGKSISITEDATVSAETTVKMTAAKDIGIYNTADVLAKGTGVTSGDTLKFDAQGGDIIIKSDAATGKEAVVMAGVVVDENTYSGDNQMTLLAAKNVKVQNRGTVAASGKMNITATADDIVVGNNARVAAGGDLTATAGTDVKVTDNGLVVTKGALGVTAGKDFTAYDNAQVRAKGNVTVGAAKKVSVKDNAVVGAGEVSGDASSVSLTAGDDMSIDGVVQARKDITLTATGDVKISDNLTTGGIKTLETDADTSATATYDDTTRGLVKAQTGSVQISATGAGKSIEVSDDATVSADTTVNMTATKDVKVLDTADVLAKGSGVTSGNTLEINAGDSILVDGNGTAGYAQVVAGDLVLDPAATTTPTITDSANIELVAAKAITVQKKAAVAASGNFTATAAEGDITVKDTAYALAGGNMTLKAEDAATKVPTPPAAVTGSVVVDKNGHVLAAGKLDVDADLNVSINDSSELRSTGNMTVDATEGYVWVNDNSVLGTSGTLKIGDGAKIGTDLVVTDDSLVTAAGQTDIKVKGNVIVDNGADTTTTYGYAAGTTTKNSAIRVGSINWKLGDSLATVPTMSGSADMNVTADKGIAFQNGAVVGATGAATLTANDGDIEVKNASALVSKGNMTLDAKDTTSGLGSVLVQNAGNVLTYGTLTATAAKDVTVQAATGTPSAMKSTLAATVTAQNGDITVGDFGSTTDTSTISSDAKVKLEATNGRVVLQGESTVSAGTTATGADVEVVAGKDIVAQDDATVVAKAAVSMTANGNTAGSAVNVTGTADVTAGTKVDIKSTAAGDITVDTTGNVVANNGNATIDNDNGNVTIQNATVQANVNPAATPPAAAANVSITATKGDVTIAKGTKSATVTAADDVVIAASDDTTTPAVEGNVVINESTVKATAGDVLVGAPAARVSSFTAWNGAVVEAGKSVKVYAADNVSLLDGTGATKVTASDGDVVIDAIGGVSVAGADITATDAGSAGAGDVEITAAGVNGTLAISVGGNANITADKAVTANATGTSAAGDISITTTGTVLAKNGNATIDNDNGSVTIANGKVEAQTAGVGNVAIDATTGVAVNAGAQVVAANNMTVDTTGGDIATAAGTTVSAGGTLAATTTDTTTPGNITLNGAVTVVGTTDFKAAGNIAANDGVNNDFGGAVTATGATGAGSSADAVTLQDKNAIDVAGVEAKGKVDVDATDITVSGAIVTTGTGATGGDVDLDASTGNIAVNAAVTAANDANVRANSAAGNVATTAAITAANDATVMAGNNVSLGANVEATAGNATVTATAGNISSTPAAVIGAGNTAMTTAGGNADVNVDANNINVTTGGNADLDVVAGTHNPTGDLTIDSNGPAAIGSSSVVAGGNVNLNVAGKLSTTGSAEINAGGNLDVKASTASTPLNIKVGGSTIGIDLANQAAVALNDHDKTYTVNGNGSHTAILIDGRLAGGDPRYFSVLSSYEGEAARGVVDGPLPVPYVGNAFAAPFITLDMPLAVPGLLGQYYMQGEAGSVDAGDAFPEADTALAIPGLPANSTIFFIPREEAKNKTAAL